jgi:hypothetical protein
MLRGWKSAMDWLSKQNWVEPEGPVVAISVSGFFDDEFQGFHGNGG